jgi:hypothetical protein
VLTGPGGGAGRARWGAARWGAAGGRGGRALRGRVAGAVGGAGAWMRGGPAAGRAFAALTLAPALVVAAWLVPGTGLLLAGRLLAMPLVIIFVPLALAFCYYAMRRLPDGWAQFGGTRVPGGALLLMLAIAAGFGVWQAFLRSEQLFTADGPAVYLQYGYWIAGHGTVRVPESAASFGGAAGLEFATTGFTAAGSSITPAALPGVPLMLAGGAWLARLTGALMMPAVLGGGAVLSFGGLVGRLCGAWQAVAAELVLALCLPEVYTARAPFSEPLVAVLLLGGLCLFIDAVALRARGGGGLAAAGLAGLCVGLTVLASAASFAVLLPVIPVLVVLLAARHPAGRPFGLGLLVGVGTGLGADLVLAPTVMAGLSGHLRLLDLCATGFCVAAALAVPFAFPRPRSLARRVCAVNLRVPRPGGTQVVLPSLGGVAQWLALVLPAVVLVGLAERPFLQLFGGQVSGSRHYEQTGVYWAAWYLGVPALLLAWAGAAALGRRTVQAVLQGDAFGSGLAVRLWALPLLMVFWSVVGVLWDPFVAPWQPTASRRLVPVVLPGLVLLAVWALSWLASHAASLGASRAAVAGVAACCVLALAVPAGVTTLEPGLDPAGVRSAGAGSSGVGSSGSGLSGLVSRVRLHGVGASATYRGSVAAAAGLCASIGSSASVLFTDQKTAAMYAPAVRELCGEPAALLTAWVTPGAPASGPGSPASPAASAAWVAQAVRAIQRTGRRPVLLGPTRASVSVSGFAPQQVIALRTAGDARTLTGAPSGPGTVTYSLWLAMPPSSAGGA